MKRKSKTYRIRGKMRAKTVIRELIQKTAELDVPRLYVYIGKLSDMIRPVMDLAADCECSRSLEVHVIVNTEIKQAIVDILEKNANFEIKLFDDRVFDTNRSFLVSEAGYYEQEAHDFDQAQAVIGEAKYSEWLIDFFNDSKQRSAA